MDMLFQDLFIEADREAGCDDGMGLPLSQYVPEAVRRGTSLLVKKLELPTAPSIDDMVTLRRSSCIVHVADDERGEAKLVKIVRFDDRSSNQTTRLRSSRGITPSIEGVIDSSEELPIEATIPRYEWELELERNMEDIASERNVSVSNTGMFVIPYYSEARARRLEESIAKTSFNDSVINVRDVFQTDSTVDIKLIANEADSYQAIEYAETTEHEAELTTSKNESASLLVPAVESVQKTSRIGMTAPSKKAPAVVLKKQLDDVITSSRNRRLFTSVSNHVLALTHKNSKPDLSIPELRAFHRPRMSASLRLRPWVVTVKGEKRGAVVASRVGGLTSHTSVDLNINHGDFALIEYYEELPPLVLNFGMASVIVNYERRFPPSSLDDEEEKNMKLQSKNMKLSKYEHRYRLPKHVKYLVEKKDFKPIFEVDTTHKLSIGEQYLLEAEEEFPFLGELSPGDMQQAVKNELFKAPLYLQSPSTTDFVLVRNKIGKDNLQYSIREIKKMFVSGQTEPLEVVPKPAKNLTKTQENFFLLGCARYFAANPNGVEWSDLKKELIRSSYGKEKLFEALLPKIGRSERYVDADYNGRSRSSRWVANSDLDSTDLEKMFSPKDVCIQESVCAAEYRLYRDGIENLDVNRITQWLSVQSSLLKFKKDKAVQVMLYLRDIRDLDTRLEIGRYIRRYLLNCPWNTTDAYKDHNSTALEVSDPCDPDGRIRGFQFVKKRSLDLLSKNTEKLQGTKSDLRQLTKEAAIKLLEDLSAGTIPRDVITKMGRWARVREIATLSKKAKEMGTGQELHKFARNVKSKFFDSNVDEFRKFKEDCIKLWSNQKEALTSSTLAGVDEDDDEDDEDDFADEDLEQELQSEALGQQHDEGETQVEAESIEDLLRDVTGPKKPQVRIDGAPDTHVQTSVLANRSGAYRPSKVVKRTTRTIGEDGSEVIEIVYVLSAKEVERVYSQEAKRRSLMESLKRKSRAGESDVVEDYSALGAGTLSIKIPKTYRTEESLMSGQNYFEREEIIERTTAQSRRTKGVEKDWRLPHVAFAVKLESILMDLWKRKIAYDFTYPVNAELVKGYYDKVKNPICLLDIRDKISKFHYISVRSFMDDLELMVENAVHFNGKDSQIAKNAFALYRDAEHAIGHERRLLGAHKDTLAILEEAIMDKFDYLKRSVPIRKSRVQTFSESALTSDSVAASVATVGLLPPLLGVSKNEISEQKVPTTAGLEEGEVDDLADLKASEKKDGDGDDGSSSGDEEVMDEG